MVKLFLKRRLIACGLFLLAASIFAFPALAHEDVLAEADTSPPMVADISSAAAEKTATLTWTTDEASATWVVYGTSLAYDQEIKLDNLTTAHIVVLENLEPDRTYFYHIRTVDHHGNQSEFAGSYLYSTFITGDDPNLDALRFQISTLLEQVRQLSVLVAQRQGQAVVPAAIASNAVGNFGGSGFNLGRSLRLGDVGQDVKNLQIFLNSNSATRVAQSGPGSPGNETTYFGPATQAAVIRLQNLYAGEILAPVGLSVGSGFVGSTTRSFINSRVAGGSGSSLAGSNAGAQGSSVEQNAPSSEQGTASTGQARLTSSPEVENRSAQGVAVSANAYQGFSSSGGGGGSISNNSAENAFVDLDDDELDAVGSDSVDGYGNAGAGFSPDPNANAIPESKPITVCKDNIYSAILSGENEVSSVETSAFGEATLTLAGNKGAMNLSFSGLSSAQSGAHIHGPAVAGENAGVLIELPSGSFETELTLSAEQIQYLKDGKLYVNVHTDNFSSGEIRGQLECGELETIAAPTPATPPSLANVHSDNLVKRAEHLALFELVKPKDATHIALKSGSWSDASIWNGGSLPGDDAKVWIPGNVVVTVSKELSARMLTVRINGTLRFDQGVDTRLMADTIVVDVDGTFEMGTASKPIATGKTAKVVFIDRGPINMSWDPFVLSRGLISHGKAVIYGEEKTPHVAMSTDPRAGTTKLTLAATPTNWRVGDRLLVHGTKRVVGRNSYVNQDEFRTIAAISGRMVTLSAPLSYDHVRPRGDLRLLHVANMSRNVRFESEAEVENRRGHVMFMHSSDVVISGAGFLKTGRTDKARFITDPDVNSAGQQTAGTGVNPRGRYAVHFHRTGAGDGAKLVTVRNSVVERTPGWGFVNHDSNINFDSNIAYDFRGSGFITEIGSEIGTFRSNMAVYSVNPNTNGTADSEGAVLGGFGSGSIGYWMQSKNVNLIDNIAANLQGEGLFFNSRAVDNATQSVANIVAGTMVNYGDDKLPVPYNLLTFVPARTVSGNTVIASEGGFHIRWDRGHSRLPMDDQVGNIFRDSEAWEVDFGAHWGYSRGFMFDGFKFVGYLDNPLKNPNADYNDLSVRNKIAAAIAGNIKSGAVVFKNGFVQGFPVAVDVFAPGETVLENIQLLDNATGIQSILLERSTASSRFLKAKNVTIRQASPSILPANTKTYDVFLMRLPGAQVVPPDQGNQNSVVVSLNDPEIIWWDGKQIYYYEQADEYVPFHSSNVRPNFITGWSGYLDKTNRQLEVEFGNPVGDSLIPESAKEISGIHGMVLSGVPEPKLVYEPRVWIDAPSVDATWARGTSKTIRWHTLNISANEYVSLELVGLDNKQSYFIERNAVNTGSYTWSNVGSGFSGNIPAGRYVFAVCNRATNLGSDLGFVGSGWCTIGPKITLSGFAGSGAAANANVAQADDHASAKAQVAGAMAEIELKRLSDELSPLAQSLDAFGGDAKNLSGVLNSVADALGNLMRGLFRVIGNDF